MLILSSLDFRVIDCAHHTCLIVGFFFFFFFKQKTAYEMRISDWSSDVCSSDLRVHEFFAAADEAAAGAGLALILARLAAGEAPLLWLRTEIGRASCRERVCQYV